MEMVHDEKKDIAYYRNAIPEAVIEFYEGIGQNDILQAPLNTWSAAMRYANRLCVKAGDLMEDYEVSPRGLHGLKYNLELVNLICDVFLELCEVYDKVPSLWAFSCLCGVPWSTAMEWAHGYSKGLSMQRLDITKKVKTAREASLANKIVDGRKNPVGAIAALNHEYGWNTSPIIEERHERPLTLAELPIFDGSIIREEKKVQELPVKGSDSVIYSVDGLPILRAEEVKNEV